jgi:hypothetical protein
LLQQLTGVLKFNRKEAFRLFQGLIIEGISGSGKTSVMEKMLVHPCMQQSAALSRIILTEHHTQRVLELKEQQGLLQTSDHIDLLDGITTFLEGMHQKIVSRDWSSPILDDAGLFFVLERFHLTHVFRFPYMQWHHVESIDRRLLHLGAQHCLLTVNAAVLEERIFTRASDCWLNYLKRYGNTPSEIIDTYMQRQQQAIELSHKSCLPLIQLDTSALIIEEIVDALFQQLFPMV